jgi:hypothetical protein
MPLSSPLTVLITRKVSLEGLVMVVAGPSECELGRVSFQGAGRAY